RTAAWSGSASASAEQALSLAPAADKAALPVIPTTGAAVSAWARPTSEARSAAGVGNASTTTGRAPASAFSACSTARVTQPGPLAAPAPATGVWTVVVMSRKSRRPGGLRVLIGVLDGALYAPFVQGPRPGSPSARGRASGRRSSGS